MLLEPSGYSKSISSPITVMGTKVQSKSYFQGYCSMRDLNEDAESGNWPLYYEDQLLKPRQYCNGFLPRPTMDGHSDYDKEMLKRTMLEHEAIFRKQVFELHRLYRIQRDLMDELKRKEMLKYPETSQSEYITSQMPSEHAQNMSHISSLPFVNSGCSRPSVSGTDSRQSPLNFAKESSKQVESGLTQNGTFKDCKFLEPNSEKLPRRMIDLQLPADEYIDSEEGELNEEDKVSQTSMVVSHPRERNSGVAPDTNVKLSLSSGGNVKHRGDGSDSNSRVWNKHSLADLNHPIEVEEARSSAPINNVLGSVSCNGGGQGHYMPAKQNSGSLGFHRQFLHRAHADNRTDISASQLENMGSRREWQSNSFEAGPSRNKLSSFSQGFCPEEFHTASRAVQAEFKSTQLPAFLLGDRSSRPLELPVHSPYPVIRDVAVQALPCFSSAESSKGPKMPIQNLGLTETQWHHHSHTRSSLSFGNEISYRNGFSHGPQLENPKRSDCTLTSEYLESHRTMKFFRGSSCMDVKSAKDFNLNLASPNGLVEGIVSKPDLVIIDGEGKNEDTVGGLPWLRPKPSSNNGPANGREASNEVGFDLMKAYTQKSTLQEKVPSPNFIWDAASTSCTRFAEDQRIQMSNCPSSKKILGFSIFDKPHVSKDSSTSSFSNAHQNLSDVEAIHSTGKVRVLDIDLSRDPGLPDSSQKQPTENLDVTEKLYKHIKNNFNLNACAEEEDPLACSGPVARMNIDLEAPAGPETVEDISLEEESQGDPLKTSAQSSQIEVQHPSEELDRIAADAILSFSSSGIHHWSEDVSYNRPETLPPESLDWFADVVSSYGKGLDSGKDGVISRGDKGDESDSDGSDYFERMTMKLPETKADEFWCTRPWASETHMEEETVAPPLPTRRRRGQARRGRQRRDFQRDILPGLSSLSRHEVTADLQTIGGLMKATGQTWESGLAARRNGARNGLTRGRRRPRNPAPTVAATVTCSPPRQETSTCEPGLDEKSLKGWGKTTRRPRRQRVAAGNAPL